MTLNYVSAAVCLTVVIIGIVLYIRSRKGEP